MSCPARLSISPAARPGEGEQEDALWGDAGLDQVGDARGERAGLAGAGTGYDEERALTVGHGLALGGVQLCKPGGGHRIP